MKYLKTPIFIRLAFIFYTKLVLGIITQMMREVLYCSEKNK